MAVVIQAMVPAEVAGVMNTVLNEGAANVVEIEAAFGYGAPVVDGEITPDRYLVDIDGTPAIIERDVAAQTRMMTRDGWRDVSSRDGRRQKLSMRQFWSLPNLANGLKTNLGGPQDVEFAVVSGQVSVVQSRPLTGLAADLPVAASNGKRGLPTGARLVRDRPQGQASHMWYGKCQVLTDLSQGKDLSTGISSGPDRCHACLGSDRLSRVRSVTNDGGATTSMLFVSQMSAASQRSSERTVPRKRLLTEPNS